jgi:hypothetical protein
MTQRTATGLCAFILSLALVLPAQAQVAQTKAPTAAPVVAQFYACVRRSAAKQLAAVPGADLNLDLVAELAFTRAAIVILVIVDGDSARAAFINHSKTLEECPTNQGLVTLSASL